MSDNKPCHKEEQIHSTMLKKLAVIEETRTAIFLIQEGLISLNSLDAANDFAHLPLLLLSNGLERLLKVIICLDYLEREGKFPDSKDFRTDIKTHKVDRLLERVICIAQRWKYADRCAATERDMDFLQKDNDLRLLLTLLAAHGDKARYYHMNVIVSERNETEDPGEAFESYCTKFVKRQEGWEETLTGNNLGEKIDANIKYVNRQITIVLQKFARALCRMFTLGRLGQLGKQQTGAIDCFLFLADEDLDKVKPPWS